jgi:tRNA threonylcarbamoyladenosine biosynthesis protein TsaB
MADFVRNTHPEFQKYMPMLDARRMEVYTAEYTAQGAVEKATHALIVDEAWAAQLPEGVLLFGDGAAKCLSLGNNFEVLSDIYPSAKMMIADAELKFGNAEFVDLAYFEPFYLKEFVPGVSTKSML